MARRTRGGEEAQNKVAGQVHGAPGAEKRHKIRLPGRCTAHVNPGYCGSPDLRARARAHPSPSNPRPTPHATRHTPHARRVKKGGSKKACPKGRVKKACQKGRVKKDVSKRAGQKDVSKRAGQKGGSEKDVSKKTERKKEGKKQRVGISGGGGGAYYPSGFQLEN